MRPHPLAVALGLSLAIAGTLQGQNNGATRPTVILTGGKVFTADSMRPWVEAIAVRGDRILAVGTTSAIERLAGPHTRRIALGGRVVIPGINDAHDHLGGADLGTTFPIDPSPTPDPAPAALLDSIRAIASRSPSGAWLAFQVGMRVLGDSTIDRTTLDGVAPNHRVVLRGWWGHGMVLNSAALAGLGIREDARDPLGGFFMRTADGRLTGRLDEYARWSAEQRLGAFTPDAVVIASLRAYADSALRVGVTSVQDMAGYMPPGRTVRLFRAARLPLRVRLVRWSTPTERSMNLAEWDSIGQQVAPRVVVDGRKWVLDGTPIERLALRRTPYEERPGWYGRLNFPIDSVRAMLDAALRPGAPQLHLHIVGDSSAELVLGAMESLAPDSVWRARRVRIEHGPSITGSRIERVARLGIVIAQPREGGAYRSWRAAGIPVAYGSDGLRNPFLHMLWATTGGRGGDETIAREEYMRVLTSGSAYAERREKDKGTLSPGKLADLSVLSQDIFTVTPQALPDTRSVLTMIGGGVVYDALGQAARVR
ncbi:MAG TPA: amidohydrolase [Gemmatimonadaceae bacterium]